jgi:alkaline phosphatase
MPYTIDHINDPVLMASTPTLAEMTKAALAAMKGSRNGFILQMEGGRVDHAAHANDLGAIIHDQLAFEEALEVVLEFARNDEETLVVVTSDHGNANPGITGKAERGKDNGLNLISGMTSSYEAMAPQLKEAQTPGSVQDLVEAKLGVKLTPEQAQAVVDAAGDKNPLDPFGNYRHATAALALVLSSHTGVGWTSGSHTSDYTIITALGPGSDLFSGLIQNTAVFGKLLSLRGLKHVNHTATLEQARAAQEQEGSLTAMAELEYSTYWV